MDGNFHHRHLVSGGKGIEFHEPRHIIPKSFVDHVGTMIQRARKSPQKSRKPKVPDSAVDECERSHEAADGDKKKSLSHQGRYDDMGWMSLVCRHDIPLFFANIDTPGEQQKYAIALILWFFSRIPSNATVTVLYDIGCVLDRSTQMVGFSFSAGPGADLHMPVRHLASADSSSRSIRYDSDACLRSPMVMPVTVQPATLSRVGPD